MKFGFYTLGCKTNQFETQAMERFLTERGHEIGSFEGLCDGYIINTCSVTAVADKKNRAVIRRCRRDNPNAVIGVCGCYTQHAPEDARRLGVDVIGGSAKREEFIEKMLEAAQKNAVIARSEATWQSPGYSEMSEKRTNALTNRPELLGDCHDQSADWSRNDSSNERANNNLSIRAAACYSCSSTRSRLVPG